MKLLSRKQWFLGVNGNVRKGFRSRVIPTPAAYPEFAAVVGPFKTKEAMMLMMNDQSTFSTVQEAENYVSRKKERRKPKLAMKLRVKDIRECGWCGTHFHKDHGFQNCCSQECSLKHAGILEVKKS